MPPFLQPFCKESNVRLRAIYREGLVERSFDTGINLDLCHIVTSQFLRNRSGGGRWVWNTAFWMYIMDHRFMTSEMTLFLRKKHAYWSSGHYGLIYIFLNGCLSLMVPCNDTQAYTRHLTRVIRVYRRATNRSRYGAQVATRRLSRYACLQQHCIDDVNCSVGVSEYM